MADREFTNINGIKVCDQTARDSIPTRTSQLENDSNFITDSEVNLSSYAKKTDLPTKTSQLTNDSGFITNVPDEYITEAELNAKRYATTSQIPTVPTNVSNFTNDAHYASETYVNNKIAEASLSGGEVDLSGYVTKETGNASQITFSDGQTFQAKLDAGMLKGDKGEQGIQGEKGVKGDTGANGQDGLTTNIVVNGNTYTHSNGTITLPNYPAVPTNVSQLNNDSNFVTNTQMTQAINNAQLGGGGGATSSVGDMFLVNNYSGTDYEKITAAINACVSNGGGIVLLDGSYTVSNTILVNADYVSLVSFAGAKIQLSTEDENLPLLKVITSDNPHGSESTCREIKGITFAGTNKKGIGIVFGNASGDTQNYSSRDIIVRDCKFYDFNIGLDYTKNAYILTHNHLSLSNCNLCVRMLEGYSNYGERIVFNDTTLCNSIMLVEMSNREGAFYFNNCSFDYSNQFIKCTGGNIYINSSHLEFRHLDVAYQWLIYCGNTQGHGSVIIKDSLLICTNPGSEKYEYLFYCDSGTSWVDSRFLIKVEDCRMIHWKSTSGFLCGGNEAGRFYITNTQLNQIPSIDFKTKANQNLNKMFRVLPEDNDPTLFTWEWVDDAFNDATVKAIKITNKSYLGSPCLVNITLPNLASSVHVDFYIRSVCENECWSRTGYKYSVAGNQYDVSAIPANSAYTQHSLGFFFPINTSTDDFVITLDLNNAKENEVFYVYIENAYQF